MTKTPQVSDTSDRTEGQQELGKLLARAAGDFDMRAGQAISNAIEWWAANEFEQSPTTLEERNEIVSRLLFYIETPDLVEALRAFLAQHKEPTDADIKARVKRLGTQRFSIHEEAKREWDSLRRVEAAQVKKRPKKVLPGGDGSDGNVWAWDACCLEHFQPMVRHVKRLHNYDGWCESSRPWPKCGYPDCRRVARREVFYYQKKAVQK